MLRLQGSIWSRIGVSFSATTIVTSTWRKIGTPFPLSGNQSFRYYCQVYHYPSFVLSLSYKSRKLPHKNISVNLCFLPILSPIVPLQYFNFSLLYWTVVPRVSSCWLRLDFVVWCWPFFVKPHHIGPVCWKKEKTIYDSGALQFWLVALKESANCTCYLAIIYTRQARQ